MARRALAALALAALLVATPAHNPCCVRVTSYHVQALAQRMAQRFQALEYRAQDLRGVFAAFQAVHGNATHRLRYLEAEHAHLSEMVSRLDSRVQVLENEKRMDDFRRREFYRRGERHAAPKTPVDFLLKSPAQSSFMMRRRREADSTELPRILVHLDQTKDSSEDIELKTHVDSLVPNSYPVEDSSLLGESLPKPLASHEPDSVHLDSSSVRYNLESSPDGSQKHPTPLSPILADATSEASQMTHDATPRDSATTPTPLWQLEETASASLDVMSESDGDVGEANVPNDAADVGVSYWSPANDTDSLENLFNPDNQIASTKTSKCKGQSADDCNVKTPISQPVSSHHVVTSTETTILLTKNHDVQADNTNFEENTSFSPSVTRISSTVSSKSSVNAEGTDLSINNSNGTAQSESGAVNVPNLVVKIPNCKLLNPVTPSGAPSPSDDKNNFTNVLHDLGNTTGPLLDLFSSGLDASSGPPVGVDGDSGSGAVPTCGSGGCDAELSDAELQAALRELDALLQRPPASAPPPDPEKALLKRALTLALGALERTSDACLKLVNFTADAFEGLAAGEA